MKKDPVTTVKQGDGIRIIDVGATVRPACADKKNGRWFCVTHQKHFHNQLEKDMHIGDGKHMLAWICFEHGAETP